MTLPRAGCVPLGAVLRIRLAAVLRRAADRLDPRESSSERALFAVPILWAGLIGGLDRMHILSQLLNADGSPKGPK